MSNRQRFVDLSAPIEASPEGTPDFLATRVDYLDHAGGAAGGGGAVRGAGEAAPRRGGLDPGDDHHRHPQLDPRRRPLALQLADPGRAAQTIEELPLELFFGPGVVVDASAKEDGDAVTAEEMEAGIAAAGHHLAEGDIVLVRSGRDAFYGADEYVALGPGVTAEATRWLYERGVRVMGIDAWGWDRPLHLQAAEALERDEPGIFWEAHQADLPYCQIERLVNLGELPPSGFRVACFPLPIRGASAAPARVVGIVG